MSRAISTSAWRAIAGAETGEAFLILLTIDHADLSQPIRVTSDAVEVVSRGESFLPFPFELSLPDDRDDQTPRATLAIDNVSREIVQAIRDIGTAPNVLMEIICAGNPDQVEASFPDFKLINVKYNAMTIRGELSVEAFSAEPYPAGVFSPAGFSGLF